MNGTLEFFSLEVRVCFLFSNQSVVSHEPVQIGCTDSWASPGKDNFLEKSASMSHQQPTLIAAKGWVHLPSKQDLCRALIGVTAHTDIYPLT